MRITRKLDSQGAATLMIIPAIMVLLLAGLLIIRNIGSATTDSRQARACADAAALGAVKAWTDLMEVTYNASAGSTELIPYTTHTFPFSFFRGTPASAYTAGVAPAAASYASANNCVVVNLNVDTVRGTVTVLTRNLDSVPNTGQRAEHQATAKFSFPSGSGACMTSGGILGHNKYGRCDVAFKGYGTGRPFMVDKARGITLVD